MSSNYSERTINPMSVKNLNYSSVPAQKRAKIVLKDIKEEEEEETSREAHAEEREETLLAIELGLLDCGQD